VDSEAKKPVIRKDVSITVTPLVMGATPLDEKPTPVKPDEPSKEIKTDGYNFI
jgi:hypothetical protein